MRLQNGVPLTVKVEECLALLHLLKLSTHRGLHHVIAETHQGHPQQQTDARSAKLLLVKRSVWDTR